MCIGNVFYTNPNVLARTIFFTAAAAALAISIDYSAMTTSAIDDDFFCIHCDFFFMSCLRFHFHNWHLLLQIGFGWSQPEADMYLPLLFRKTYRRKMLSGTRVMVSSIYVVSFWDFAHLCKNIRVTTSTHWTKIEILVVSKNLSQ